MEAEELGRYRWGPGAALGPRVVQSPLPSSFYPGPGGAGASRGRAVAAPLPSPPPGPPWAQSGAEGGVCGGARRDGPGAVERPCEGTGKGWRRRWAVGRDAAFVYRRGARPGSAGFAVGEARLTCGGDRQEGRAWGCAFMWGWEEEGKLVGAGEGRGGLRAGPGVRRQEPALGAPCPLGCVAGPGSPAGNGRPGLLACSGEGVCSVLGNSCACGW